MSSSNTPERRWSVSEILSSGLEWIAQKRTALTRLSESKTRSTQPADAGEYRDPLQRFIEQAPAALAMFDCQMRYLAASPRWQSDFKLGGEDLKGRCHYDVFPEISEPLMEIHRRSLAGEVLRGVEEQFARADGTVQWLNWEVRPWQASDDRIGGIIISSEDVSDRKRAELALKESEAHFRAVFEVASIGMAQADPHTGQWRRVNRKLTEITGYSQAEMLHLRIPEITHPDDRAADWKAFQAVIRGESPAYRMEKRYLRKDGSIAWVSVNMTVLRDAAGEPTLTVATIEEITARKQAEDERLRLTAAMDQAAESICITDTDATILYVNPAFERSTGYARAEVLGRTPRILKSGKQGTDFYAQMWSTLKRGQVWRGHLVNRRKDGALFEEDAAISPVRSTDGAITNYVAIKLDVTREMELQAQVRQVQKLDAIGQLAGGVAHDFNNILALILMQAEQALQESQPSEIQSSLMDIRAAAERAASLTRQLLQFSRQQVMQPQTLDLNDVVTNLSNMLRRVLGEEIHLRLEIHGKPLWAHVDSSMLDQVVLNLSINARDAMPNGGLLTISTSELHVAQDTLALYRHAKVGAFVSLSVQDCGCGIPSDVLPKIFEPFFTTKEPGKGTGLGLATVYGIVEQHGGWVHVQTALGQGTTFQVFLPMCAPRPMRSEVPVIKTNTRGGGETILLVEDDVNLRKAAKRILERHGYCVLVAGEGKAALEIGSALDTKINLLLTDLVLPLGIDGREIATQLRSHRPDLGVVFMSGYSPELAGRALTLQQGEAFIQKPFETDDLLRAIRRVLEG